MKESFIYTGNRAIRTDAVLQEYLAGHTERYR
jgi:hypothetical protein